MHEGLRKFVAHGPCRVATSGNPCAPIQENDMQTILLILLIVLLIDALPTWPYSHGWGYHPSERWACCLSSCSFCG